MSNVILGGIAIGIGATVLMDIYAIVLSRFFGQSPANWAPVGRWVWHLKSGKVFHDSIANAAPYEHELALGWIFHYAVGILYGIVLTVVMGSGWLQSPTFMPAWIWSIITVGAGWFLLQPGLGIGFAASKLPNPSKARFMNLAAHTVFAIGLYGTAILIG